MKIGLFDSGIGGLSVYQVIRNHFPNFEIVYFADNANLPYGNKSKDWIAKRSLEISEFLIDQGVQLILIACNTASIATNPLVHMLQIPVIDMIDCTCASFSKIDPKLPLALLGTQFTIQSEKYQKLILNKLGISCYGIPCKNFCSLVEEDLFLTPLAFHSAHEYLAPVLNLADLQLLLVCTHFPWMKQALLKTKPDLHCILDPAESVVELLRPFYEEVEKKEEDLFFCSADWKENQFAKKSFDFFSWQKVSISNRINAKIVV